MRIEGIWGVRKMATINKSAGAENLAYASDGRYRNDAMMSFFSELLYFYEEIRTLVQETGDRKSVV